LKRILVTGGAGYIGSVMTGELLKAGYQVVVLDRFFFGQQSLEQYKDNKNLTLIRDDIRYFDEKILTGINTVIDLAGISNDPACDLNPKITTSVNQDGCIRVARLAQKMGVSQYLFSSSCSIYGDSANLKLTEKSPVNPVSLYALSKLRVEEQVLPMANKDFSVTILRNGTVYGLSQRMRLDLVINVMAMNAYRNGKIYILGGGKQWRPMVHIKDVAHAFIKVIEADKAKVSGQIFNVGSNEQNYQVIQMAHMVKDIIPHLQIEVVPEDPDKRNYNVCFDKISSTLGYRVERTIHEGVVEIKLALENGQIDPDDLRTVTLKYYKYLLEAEKILKEVNLQGTVF
jgi:nucleoside-diphosphate-sugar epimerase